MTKAQMSADEEPLVELFKIICVTCQAKLSVRNESLIGQIVACPRCDSMVEIISPAVAAVAPAVAEPATVIKKAVASEPAVLPEEVPPPVVEAELLQASAEVAKYKLLVWSLASVLVGAVLVGGMLYSRNSSSKESPAVAPSSVETANVELPAVPVSEEEPTVVSPPVVETPPAVALKVDPPSTEIVESTPKQPVVTETVEQPPVVAPIEKQAEAAPRVARRFDPLDFDPESLTLAAVDQPTEAVETPASELMDVPLETLEEVPSTVPLVRRGPDEGEDASGRDAEKQLALLIPGVKFRDLLLVDYLRLVSQLSGVPVSVAPEQLLMAGITPQQKVSFEKKGISLGEMLTHVLKPLRLEYSTQGSQVIVTRQDATKRREINYPIDDLVGAETDAELLASWVEQLVAPSTWRSAGGQGTLEVTPGNLRIEQTQQVQYQVLILLERLRLARNRPPRSRYPVKRLAGTPANVLLQKILATHTTFTFSQYTPIDEVFVHWQTEIGVPLLIDWPALAEAEVWPSTTIACAIIDQPWSIALEKILEPLGLGWRATASGAIEITSAKKVQNELQLELYSLRNDFDGDARSLAKLQAGGVILYDPAEKTLLVLESAVAQRAIVHRLGELGTLKGE